MYLCYPPVEHVMPIPKQETYQNLRDSYSLYYRTLAGGYETKYGVERCFSGLILPFQNAVFGYPSAPAQWDLCIDDQLQFSQNADRRFVWYLGETTPQAFIDRLTEKGFSDVGIFRAVMGPLDHLTPPPLLPVGYSLHRVEDELALAEFNDLVCATFGIPEQDKASHLAFLWKAMQTTPPLMVHWVVRKEGKVVSTLSTQIHGDLVSFWNGATLSEERRKGLSTALRQLALQDASARGCTLGASYLMSEGLAFGICSKLGFETKWQIKVFLSPPIQINK
ncbi:MAG TPA: GNAT family N-acetyltransferase [Chlamydiales bacterium]|nr:GNAT family N-acetyltransferase [Chlamydiales bacterium]